MEGTYGKPSQKAFTDDFRTVWMFKPSGITVYFGKEGTVDAISFKAGKPGRAPAARAAGRAPPRLPRRGAPCMRLIGLTGGIATGKSTFAAALRQAGAPVLDADQLARAAVAKGTPGLAALVAQFGPDVLTETGDLDRRRMAARVFADPEERARLEAIVHPAVRALFRAERDRLSGEGHPVAFYDVPLLYEAGLVGEVDLVVVVWAPRAVQLARLLARDGLSAAEAAARLAAQLPIDDKAARADVVVVNDGDLATLAGKAPRLLADLRRGLSRKLPNAPAARY